MYIETRSGLLNYNRSTNGASGMLPFGGVGKSGNQRAAGIDAVRYSTFPVAIQEKECGDVQTPSLLAKPFAGLASRLKTDAQRTLARHDTERLLERYGLAFDDAVGGCIYIHEHSFSCLSLDGAFLKSADWVAAGVAQANHQGVFIEIPQSGDLHSFTERLESFLDKVFAENADQLLVRRATDINIPAQGDMPRSEAFCVVYTVTALFPLRKVCC